MNPIILTTAQYRQIESEGVAAFPSECCGVMIGQDVTGADGAVQRIVDRVQALTNSFEQDEQYHRFRLDPLEYMQAEKAAAAEGKLLLGFYHSHPDHPARPSETDRIHGWPFYSYIIVSIMAAKPALMTSWVLDEQTEQFSEQLIERRD